MLTLDYANCLSPRVGDHGLDPDSLAPGSDAAVMTQRLTERLASTRGAGMERWRQLPFDPMRRQHLDAVEALAHKAQGRFDNLVVLGIGGSALGSIALHAALNPPFHNMLPASERNGPRVFIIDNVDPAHLGSALDLIQRPEMGGLERTLFNVISKSGETAETASQFLTIRKLLIDALGRERHAQHIIAVTDPEQGTMRAICDENGYATLPVPQGVGGRFSVLSPVGLFSARISGIDIASLLQGAASMDERCSTPELQTNPAAMLACLLVRLSQEKGKTNHVLMPYCNALASFADWFRQLWAESLGKRVDLDGRAVNAGFTPISALGATDQHSQIQLYREGPNDKVIGFLEIASFGDRELLTIPSGLGVESLAYLEGATFAKLLRSELAATTYALVESQRPNFTIRFDRLDARSVGEFIQLWEVATAYAALMLNIDAYDQPAVELGKQATFGLMGKTGAESFKETVEKTLIDTPFTIG